MISLSGKLKFFIVLSALILTFILTSEWHIGMIDKRGIIAKLSTITESNDLNAEDVQKKNMKYKLEIDLLENLNTFLRSFEEKNEDPDILTPREATKKSPNKVEVVPIPQTKAVEPVTTVTKIQTTVQPTTPKPTTTKLTTQKPTTTKPTTQNPTTRTFTTPLDKEKQIGLHIIRQHCADQVFLDELRKNDKGICPTTGIVSAPQGGRLGNQIFEYAGVFVHAKTKGLAGYIAPCIKTRLDSIFENLSLPTLDTIANCPFPQSKIRYLESWKFTNQSLFLYYHYQDVQFLMPHIKDLLQEFKILPSLTAVADKTLQNAKKKIFPNEPSVTYVGVHVRRTDYGHHLKVVRNDTLCTTAYFFSAMKYYENKFNKVVFIIASDSPEWCTEKFGNKTNVAVVSGKTTVEEDMAILARCNHSIIDYGTYGAWCALLAGGETVVKKMHNEEPSGQIPKYLPNWIAMEDPLQ